jgi:predicted SAM-dependent methyltransferase
MVSQEMDFSSLELDLSRENLDWDRVLYLNGDKIPLPRFKEIMEDLRSEFTGQLKPEPAASGNNFTSPMGFFSSMSQKIKTIVKAMLSKAGYEIRRIPPEVTEKPQARKSGLRLYVGCGTDSRHGFEGCDTRPLPNVSIVCKAWEISRNCTEVKEIYSRHMLEHLTLPQVEETLRDWLCALAEGGRIHVVVPNMDFHVEQWRRAAWNEEEWNKQFSDARHSFAGFWGWQRESDSEALRQSGENAFWDIHKCGFNCEFLAFLLEREGFTNISCEVADDVHVVATALKPL